MHKLVFLFGFAWKVKQLFQLWAAPLTKNQLLII